jgi:predicted TIM-barrel fold metal-dependent hydrolase
MSTQEKATKPPIINCHTHIFTGDHIPPFLARSIAPWPLYFLFSLRLVIKGFRFYYSKIDSLRFKPFYRKFQRWRNKVRLTINHNRGLSTLAFLVGGLLTLQVFFIIFDWLCLLQAPSESIQESVEGGRQWLIKYWLLLHPVSGFGKFVLVLLLILFFKPGRNLIFLVIKKIWSFLGALPGPESKQLFMRYLNIGRFSFYKQQFRIFGRLKMQYPPDTGFVVLPMDMDYMGSGKVPKEHNYQVQMEQLAKIKARPAHREQFFPFVFADPRRLREEGESHFSYRLEEGAMKLNDCFIKEYMEQHEFSGFKIYPALGYYVFEEELLPLWKYAADHGFPILTHCIKGTIYYRGRKEKRWDYHPVFEQPVGEGEYAPLMLPQTKNSEYTLNFTHPMNYLCLLEEKLLRKLVGQAKDEKIRTLFGYTDADTPLQHDLSHLKICFGHFGGEDQWLRYFEQDRNNYSSQLLSNPDRGISFLTNDKGEDRPGKPEQIWKYADWYSIICSLMLQYPHVYGDLSYILHDNRQILSLLKQTLRHPTLRKRVLFGTDFYVVRNHKSEKNMLADLMAGLSEADFDSIARNNPIAFLHNNLHTNGIGV